MGKYGEALGIWNLKIGGANLKLKPRKGDNLELMEIMKKNKNDESNFFKDINNFLIKIIERDVPPASDEEKDELYTFVEFNLMELFKEMMIAFRWATPESIKEMEKQDLKKAI